MTPDLDPTTYLRVNWQLHERLAKVSPNAILREFYLAIMESLRAQLTDVSMENHAERIRDGVRIHTELIEAIASRDLNRVDAASLAHRELTSGSSLR